MSRFQRAAAFAAVVAIAIGNADGAEDVYALGAAGEDCAATCAAKGLQCNPAIRTNNSDRLFVQLGVKCNSSAERDPTKDDWWV